MINKNNAAMSPPMGWNSWDCYGASVNEKQLLENAAYMAAHLKEHGYQYVVCDIQWYEPLARDCRYNNFYPLAMDAFSRLIPAENRFPSAAGGRGFAPIAEKIHAMGLKFGIHIMRGIPRQAVHAASPIKGTDATARDIAHPFSLCSWNTDMYGVNPAAKGAGEYYDSLFELYASWGVDFVKVDDICVTEFKPYDPYSARREIELIRAAIDKCGRKIVLSLSPGPASLDAAYHLSQNANMWRMTGDFWDNWRQLYAMFERCERWQPYVKPGCYPDCDMLPLGTIEVFNRGDGKKGRHTNFSNDEVRTMLTLWSIFRSPLILGCEMTLLDDETLSMITNDEIIAMNQSAHDSVQLCRTDKFAAWMSKSDDGAYYAAMFNLADGDQVRTITLPIDAANTYTVRDLWTKSEQVTNTPVLTQTIPPHAPCCVKLTPKQ